MSNPWGPGRPATVPPVVRDGVVVAGMSRVAWRRALVGLVAVLAVTVVGTGHAQGGLEATVEVRVWQALNVETDIRISARPAGGSWRTLGTFRLPLDDGTSSTGQYRYGDIAIDVPLANRAWPATVEVRVWQDVGNTQRIYISARPAGGDWGSLGTRPFPLTDGLSSNGRFRYGDISLDVPLPETSVRTLARVDGVQSTVFAGQGTQGLVDGRGRSARFTAPGGLALDGSGNLIVADNANRAIRSISPDGTVTTIAGNGERGYRDGPCEEARFEAPRSVAVHADGSIYVTDSSRIRRIERGPAGECAVTTVAGREDGSTGRRDGPAAHAEFFYPAEIAFDSRGNLFIADAQNGLIRRLSPDGQVTTVAGGGARFGGATYAGLSTSIQLSPWGLDVDDEGNVFFTDTFANTDHTIRKLDGHGYVSTALSTPNYREGGALSPFMGGLAIGPDGELYVADGSGRLLRFTRDGILAIVVDAGVDGGLVVAPDGTLFVSSDGSVIRKITIDEE